MFKKFSSILVLCLALVSVGCNQQEPSLEGSPSMMNESEDSSGLKKGETLSEETTEKGATGTYAGNPLSFNLKGASILALKTADTREKESNLYIMTEKGLRGVITSSDSTQNVPKVKQIFTGPQGTIVLLLNDPILIKDEDCQFIRILKKNTETVCIDSTVRDIKKSEFSPDLFSMRVTHPYVQFDNFGNIYYRHESRIKRWDAAKRVTKKITQKGFLFDDFLVASMGKVYFVVLSSIRHESLIEELSFNGLMQTIYSGRIDYIDWFIKEGHLIVAGEKLYMLRIKDGRLTPISDYTKVLNKFRDSYSHSILIDSQFSHRGYLYSLFTNEDKTGSSSFILEFRNKGAFLLDTTSSFIDSFKVIDGFIFYIGEGADGRQIFQMLDPSGKLPEIDLLGGENIQVYQFIVDENIIYIWGYDLEKETYKVTIINRKKGALESAWQTSLNQPLLDLKRILD